ncbi:MAG: ABC transporter ATP-binding protein [Lachnospiraceae bacterium]|jgi:ABC-2 type transport system ATP-binding protein|nr:ABC transporter ATP-binding protein [Lachnospiraceae bacterium]MDE6816085.1 ABC transporter ATP-binding protein [Lachnospiraceae bacterium]
MSGLVEIRNLTKVYEKKRTALDGLNLVIPRGKIVGLLGPNGSGKTTLIKILNGLLVPTGGQVLINGAVPGAQTKARISYLPERTYFQNSMRVKELLEYFADFYEDFRMERAREMLLSLHINENDRIKSLSKGTREKVQLILVMSRDADLYVLDEPIAGVDPAARDYIIKTIIKNYNEKATVLLSTHLISDIENILDEVIFIREGRLLLQTTVEEIREVKGKSVDSYFREVFAC